jgi:hypothetical protein
MSKSRQRAYQDVPKNNQSTQTEKPEPEVVDKEVTESQQEEVVTEPTTPAEPVVEEVFGATNPEAETDIAAKINAMSHSAREAAALSVKELYNATAQEVRETIIVEPVVVPPPAPHVPPSTIPEGNPFSTVGARLAYEELNDYLRTLSQKVTPTQEQGAALQSSLHRALLGAINAPAEEFNQVIEYFLAVFRKEQDGLFSARNRFRWLSGMNQAPAALENFRQLVTLFSTVAEPKGRELAIRQTPWHSVLGYRMIKDESRQRVMAFFGV